MKEQILAAKKAARAAAASSGPDTGRHSVADGELSESGRMSGRMSGEGEEGEEIEFVEGADGNITAVHHPRSGRSAAAEKELEDELADEAAAAAEAAAAVAEPEENYGW